MNNVRVNGKVTLIEVVFLPLYILLLYSSARWGYHRDGWRGVVGGLIAVLVVNSGGSTSRPMTVQSSLASGCGRMTGYSEIFQDAI